MKIAVTNTLPIPSGEASVNRILSYTKELRLLGHDVSIISSARSNIKTDTIEGVVFHNVGSKNPISSLRRVLSALKKGHFEIVIVVSNSLLLIYPIAILSLFCHFKLVLEKSEFPFVLMKKGFLNRIYASFYVNTTYRLFDGLVVMTKPLMDYFASKVKRKCKMLEMPMTVDVERFHITPNPNYIGEYVAYCGNMSNKKDGIVNLIDSFVMVEQKFPNVKLVLIGGTNDNDYLEALKQRVKNLGLNNVVFYGKVPREEMPSLLMNAKALLLARPSSLQSSGGFPTKLGEYLSTGKPVVVTAVGDIPLYLNRTNSFIVPPDNNAAFAEAINDILADYPNALKIGAEGKKLADTKFNAKVQTVRLEKYLMSL